jgi:RNA polymerase sigma-70 factor (ECF subfamily)
MHEGPSDAALVAAARAGDKEAFARLIERHQGMLRGLCRRALGDRGQVEDAVQEAVLQALLSLDRLQRPERFGAWLGGIGLNLCRRWLRARRGAPWSWEELVGGHRVAEAIDARTPSDVAEDAELAERVRRAVNCLPAGQRAAVALFYLEGLSLAGVAAQLDVEVGAVKQRLHKGRAKLRVDLAELRADLKGVREMGDQQASNWLDARVLDVRRVPVAGRDAPMDVVVLEMAEDGRRVPIWMGRPEADAMALHLTGRQTPRPMTYVFAARVLQAAGGSLAEARITRLTGDVFYAEVVVRRGGAVQTVDSRPSDAINLALVLDRPIRVEASVFDALASSAKPATDPFAPDSIGAQEIAGAFPT